MVYYGTYCGTWVCTAVQFPKAVPSPSRHGFFFASQRSKDTCRWLHHSHQQLQFDTKHGYVWRMGAGLGSGLYVGAICTCMAEYW